MNKLGISSIAILVMLVLAYGFYGNIKKIKPTVEDVQEKTDAHNRSVEQYTKKLQEVLDNDKDSKIKNSSGSVSNFEGPQLSIQYISHHGQVWDKEKQPNFTLNSSTAIFDPDHQDYGLPDFRIELSQPKFVSPVESGVLAKNIDAVKKFLPGISEISPIKSYTKTYVNSDNEYKKVKFDLYLTEFEITVGIKPLRKKPLIAITSAQKKERKFPREWYQDNVLTSSSNLVSLDDLRHIEEYKNQRYSRIFAVFKIQPNPAAWYIDSSDGKQVNAEVAIGSIVSKHIESNMKVQYKEAHIDPGSPGINVDMFTGDPTLGGRFDASSVLQNKPENVDESIFNKDVYFRITSNNIGSWDEKVVFWGEEWDDQFTIKFFMPILVKGELDVVLNPDLIPKYQPTEAYYNRFTLGDLVPDWGLERFGKILSYILMIFCLVVLVVFMPNVLGMFNSLFGLLIRKIKQRNPQ